MSETIPIKAVLEECDKFFNSGNSADVITILEVYRDEARRLHDRAGELSLLSELMGHYRMAGDKNHALAAINDAITLLESCGDISDVTSGTIYINAATAARNFDELADAERYFNAAQQCYQRALPEDDLRFAALFNNMASLCEKQGDFSRAEEYYLRALDILTATGKLMDTAVTYINLAQLYANKDESDPLVKIMLDAASGCFDHPDAVRDGYYAHTCKKCASLFGALGRGDFENELLRRAEQIYAGN